MSMNTRGPIVKAHELQAHDIIDLQAIFEENDMSDEVTRRMERDLAAVEFVSVEDGRIQIVTDQGNITVDADYTVELF